MRSRNWNHKLLRKTRKKEEKENKDTTYIGRKHASYKFSYHYLEEIGERQRSSLYCQQLLKCQTLGAPERAATNTISTQVALTTSIQLWSSIGYRICASVEDSDTKYVFGSKICAGIYGGKGKDEVKRHKYNLWFRYHFPFPRQFPLQIHDPITA